MSDSGDYVLHNRGDLILIQSCRPADSRMHGFIGIKGNGAYAFNQVGLNENKPVAMLVILPDFITGENGGM